MRRLVPIILLLFITANCSEYFGRKPADVDMQLAELLLQYASGGGSASCGRVNFPPIRGGADQANIQTGGTRQGFNLVGCTSDADLSRLGFTSNAINFTPGGAKGTATNSRIASSVDFVTQGGRKDQNVEVTFTLDPGGSLDVILNASVGSNATASGPGFRITTATIVAIGTAIGTTGPFNQGAAPATPEGTEKTYCLEVHDEGTAHLFGWDRPCASLTQNDRTNYQFDLIGFASQNPGNRVGFVLNGATIKSFVVSERIGLSGKVVGF
ncbi:hypothetical protein [Leptospira sp. GIMC2001]|uniref:hypothetical protein n=1 Tax=Leptospira sp. GIMC2001 TaxID=1513297 RepID=UPI00234B164A|nr:hypothetical protein [Leptospira sp. GIMC2001]WCL48399.1 hypothetical protein O4O04_13935 [Leptospira sp. GIMC2001]